MRKIILISVIMALCALSYAQLSVTSDFSYSNTTFTTIASGSYNFVTNHFYATDWDDAPIADLVAILNADGTEHSPAQSLSVSGVPLGSLNVFALACTTDGVLYGGTNEVAVDTPQTLIRWASESATPTYQQFGTLGGDLLFVRNIDIAGTGADTKLAITGSDDNCPVQILTTSDGVTFAIAETTNPLLESRQGVAISNDGNILFSSQAYTGNLIRKWIFSGTPGTWNEDTAFVVDNLEVFGPILMDYWDENDVLFAVSSKRPTSELVVGINGADGSLLASADLGQDINVYGYGSMELNLSGTGGEGRWIGRNGSNNGYACGKFTFDLPTPTPTPIVEAANSVWGLYE